MNIISNIFDKYGYTAYPETIVELAKQLKDITDDYRQRKITNDDFEEIISFHVENNSEKLFTDDKYNITVQRFLGKRRLSVLDTVLEQLRN